MPLALTGHQDRVLKALLSLPREEIASATSVLLRIGDRDLTGRYEGGVIKAEADAPGVTLEADVLADLEGREGERVLCELRAEVDGLTADFRLFTGEVVRAEQKGRVAGLTAGTTGYYHSRRRLGESPKDDVELQTSPTAAILTALDLLPYPTTDIPYLRGPAIHRSGEDRFSWTATVEDILDEVEDKAGLTIYDDAYGVAVGYTEHSLERPGDPALTVRAGEDYDTEDLSREPRHSERYREVIVYRRREDGTDEPLARALIDIPGYIPAGVNHLVEHSDDDERTASERAYLEAEKRAANAEENSVDLIWLPPRLTRGDTLRIEDASYSDDEVKEANANMLIHGYEMDLDQLRATYSGPGKWSRALRRETG